MLSARILIVRPLTDLVRLLPLLAALLFLRHGNGSGVVYSVAASGLAVVSGVLHWATTRYKITAERVYLRHGWISRRVKSVARDRVRTVDVTAHLLHRVVGVRRVSIGTGRNDFRPGESFHLDGLTAAEADAMRVLLLPVGPAGLSAVAAPGAPPGAGAEGAFAGAAAAGAGKGGAGAGEIVAMRLGWLRFGPLTMTGLVVLSVIVGMVRGISGPLSPRIARGLGAWRSRPGCG